MASLFVEKVVSVLPSTLTPNAIYYVRTGAGFDIYVSDVTGAVAHKLNPPESWDHLLFWPAQDATPASTTAGGVSGTVKAHTKGGRTVFRFIPSTPNPAQDAFYSTYTAGNLSGLIVTRG